MAVHWRGRAFGPGELADTIFSGDWTAFPTIGASALRRTIASCQVSYANEDLPPALVASGTSSLYLRVLTIRDGDDPPGGWPTEPDSGTDDVLIAPIIWNVGLALPAGFTVGSTANVFYHGSVAGGLVDSAAQRKFEVGERGHTWVSVGPIAAVGEGFALDSFTAQIMVRQLWDDSPR